MTEKEMQLVREARRKWAREYRKTHPEKIKEANARYWLKRALREQAATAKEEADGQPEG